MMKKTAFVTAMVMTAVCVIAAWPSRLAAQELVHIGSYDTLVFATGVIVQGDYAYVTDNIHGLGIINISNPVSPFVMGNYHPLLWILDMDICGDTVYLAAGLSEPYMGALYIVDVTDKQNPYLLGSLSFQFEVTTVAVSINPDNAQDYAYISIYGNDRVIDVSNPTAPVEVGTFSVPGFPAKMVCRGSYLYVAASDQGLQILDISNPTAPQLLEGCDTPGSALDLALSEVFPDYIFVADNDSGIQVIHNPSYSYPQIAGHLQTPDRATEVALRRNAYLSAAIEDSGLAVINIDYPDNLQIVDTALGLGRAQGVDVDGTNIFLVSGESLDIFFIDYSYCAYTPGDISGNGSVNGLDVTYGVAFFRGGSPPILCHCPPHGAFYVSGDVNGNCAFNGIDITYYVAYLKGLQPELLFCPDCPPAGDV